MKVVVDTNVIAHFLLGTPKYLAETRAFWENADELIAPAVWEAEIATVVWMAARSKVITRDDATAKLALAGRLRVQSVNNRTLWHGALSRALHSGIAVYDTLFIELADRESAHLATFDQKILKAFPSSLHALATLLAESPACVTTSRDAPEPISARRSTSGRR